mgnify:CR=1 FL=1
MENEFPQYGDVVITKYEAYLAGDLSCPVILTFPKNSTLYDRVVEAQQWVKDEGKSINIWVRETHGKYTKITI